MPGARENEFETHLPSFTDEEAAKALAATGEVVSLNARSGTPDLFVVCFATRRTQLGPLALNPQPARALLHLLSAHVERLGA
jgi:hypothetical protein